MKLFFRSQFFRFSVLLLFFVITSVLNVNAQSQAYPVVAQVSFPSDTVSILGFGAKANGQYLNTASINQAIDHASVQGGGVVVIPAGLWLSGPILLKSNVNLHIQRGAVLLFTDDFDQYKLVETNWEGQPYFRNQSPISGDGLENVAITGEGVIDGNGGAWRMVKREKMTDRQWRKLVASGGIVDEKAKIWYPTESSLKGSQTPGAGVAKPGAKAEDFTDVKDFLRPNLLVLTSSKRILLEGITIQNSPAWNLHPLMCEDLTLRRVNVRNPWYAQNGDGVDIESCKNVLVEDCTFDVGDDAICIKSGRDEAGRKRGKPTENVWIRNNVVYHGHGGFVIGSEMSGGARNIWVEDCTFIGTDIGLRFKTTRGRGGVVENIFIKNIQMVGIPGEAILFDMYYGIKETVKVVKSVTEETPQFRNFHISNVHVKGAEKGVFFRGLPEMYVENIHIENATIEAVKGIDIIESSNITLRNIDLKTSKSSPVILVNNGRNIELDDVRLSGETGLLFHITGDKSKDIRWKNGELTGVKNVSKIEGGAREEALQIN